MDFRMRWPGLCSIRALHARMRQAARLYALSASWDAVFEGVYSTYDEVLASHGR